MGAPNGPKDQFSQYRSFSTGLELAPSPTGTNA